MLFLKNQQKLKGFSYNFRNYKANAIFFYTNKEKIQDLKSGGYSFGIFYGDDDTPYLTFNLFSIQTFKFFMEMHKTNYFKNILLIGGGVGGIDLAPLVLYNKQHQITYNDINPTLLEKFKERTGIKPNLVSNANSIRNFDKFLLDLNKNTFDFSRCFCFNLSLWYL